MFLILILTQLISGFAFAKKSFIPKAFEADFLQKKQSLTSKRITEKSLNIKYQFPSDFYLKEGGASPTIYVCNKSKVYIYTPPFEDNEPGNLAIGSTSKHCYSKIFNALKYGLTPNKAYGVQSITGGHFQLNFLGLAKEQLGVDKIDLFFKTEDQSFNNIQKLVIYYKGDSNPLTLETITIKPVNGFSPAIFKFVPPKNTITSEL